MKLVSSASLIVGAALSLAACGQNNKSATKSAKKFPEQTAQKTAKKGAATLNLIRMPRQLRLLSKKALNGQPASRSTFTS